MAYIYQDYPKTRAFWGKLNDQWKGFKYARFLVGISCYPESADRHAFFQHIVTT